MTEPFTFTDFQALQQFGNDLAKQGVRAADLDGVVPGTQRFKQLIHWLRGRTKKISTESFVNYRAEGICYLGFIEQGHTFRNLCPETLPQEVKQLPYGFKQLREQRSFYALVLSLGYSLSEIYRCQRKFANWSEVDGHSITYERETPRWALLGVQPLATSSGKPYERQVELLGEGLSVPSAQVVLQAWLMYLHAANKPMFEWGWVRTSTTTEQGRVCLRQDAQGVHIQFIQDDRAQPDLGLAYVREP